MGIQDNIYDLTKFLKSYPDQLDKFEEICKYLDRLEDESKSVKVAKIDTDRYYEEL